MHLNNNLNIIVKLKDNFCLILFCKVCRNVVQFNHNLILIDIFWKSKLDTCLLHLLTLFYIWNQFTHCCLTFPSITSSDIVPSKKTCIAINYYSQIIGMNKWCQDNCGTSTDASCYPDVCQCSGWFFLLECQ